MLLAGLLLVSWAVPWLLAGPPLGLPAWRVGLGLACLISGVWLACLLAQLAAFWRLLRREWQRRAVAALLVALVFAGPPLVAWRLWGGQRTLPPAAVVLLLTNPIAGCIVAFDPVAPLAGSDLATRADAILPLGACPLAVSLLLAAALCLLLRRQRRRLQTALATGLAPPERELEEADAAA